MYFTSKLNPESTRIDKLSAKTTFKNKPNKINLTPIKI